MQWTAYKNSAEEDIKSKMEEYQDHSLGMPCFQRIVTISWKESIKEHDELRENTIEEKGRGFSRTPVRGEALRQQVEGPCLYHP